MRAIHARVTGTLDDGTPYAASDPHLLLWVHVAEIDSFLRTHQTYGRLPLDQAGRDEYVAQTAEVARRLGVLDPPTTEAELAEVLEALPARAARHPARPGGRASPALAPRPPVRRPAGVRRAGRRRDRLAARLGPARSCGCRGLPVSGPSVTRALGRAATSTIRWAMTPQRLSSTSDQGR